jgi:hypothetical protein
METSQMSFWRLGDQTELPILPLIELNSFSVVATNLHDAVTASDPSLRDAWLAS